MSLYVLLVTALVDDVGISGVYNEFEFLPEPYSDASVAVAVDVDDGPL